MTEKCIAGCKVFDGGERKHHKDCAFYQQSLSRIMDEQELIIERLKDVIRMHHNWHQQEGLQMKLGDEYFDTASNYSDSALEEQTTSALKENISGILED